MIIIKNRTTFAYYFHKMQHLKRLLIYILVIQLATGHNALVEMFRLPSLIEHFKEHYAENNMLSVSQFLYLHYADEHHHDADTKHEKLPMHCHGHFTLTNVFFVEDITHFSFLQNTITSLFFEKKEFYFCSKNLISTYLFSILQPPRF